MIFKQLKTCVTYHMIFKRQKRGVTYHTILKQLKTCVTYHMIFKRQKSVWRHMVLLWEWGKQLALKCKWSAPYGAVPSNRQRQVVGKFFFFGQINLIRIKLHDHSWLFHQSLKKLAVVERLFDSWGHSLVVVALVERWPFLRSLFWSESSLV